MESDRVLTRCSAKIHPRNGHPSVRRTAFRYKSSNNRRRDYVEVGTGYSTLIIYRYRDGTRLRFVRHGHRQFSRCGTGNNSPDAVMESDHILTCRSVKIHPRNGHRCTHSTAFRCKSSNNRRRDYVEFGIGYSTLIIYRYLDGTRLRFIRHGYRQFSRCSIGNNSPDAVMKKDFILTRRSAKIRAFNGHRCAYSTAFRCKSGDRWYGR